MEKKRLLQIISSVKGTLMAHPDNEPNSEFEDRISSLQEIQDSFELSESFDLELSDITIAKAACKEMGISWEDECDIYDSVRIKLWCEGAEWMQKQLKK